MDATQVEGHSYHGVYAHRMKMFDLFVSRNTSGDNKLSRGSLAKAAHGFQRHALHQALSVNVRVEECRTPRFQRPHHLSGRNRSVLTPAANGNSSCLGVDSEHQSLGADGACNLLREG